MGRCLSILGTQDKGRRELASGPQRALKDLASLVIEFEGVQPGRVLWAPGWETPIQKREGDGVASG